MNTSVTAALTIATIFGIAGAAVVILYGAEAVIRRFARWWNGRRDGVEP
jgi:hypothetical protein